MTSILANGQAAGTVGMIVWLVVLFAVMYFLMIRPQKKERQKQQEMLSSIAVGDTILTRKQHPCGAASFEVLRVGMDFKIRCTGCGREVMLPRAKIEKNIKKVIKPGQE